MARILVCILSDQAIPNLASIIHYKPEKIIFLESKRAKENNFDGKILESLKDRGVTFTSDCIHKVSVADENSILELQNKLATTVSFYSTSDELIVNITGGTKPMSIATYNFFSTRMASIVYNIPKDEILNSKNDEKQSLLLNPPITCKQSLLAFGFKFEGGKETIASEEVASIKEIAKVFCNDELIDFSIVSQNNINLSESEKREVIKKHREKKRKRGGIIGKDFTWNSSVPETLKNLLSKHGDKDGKFSPFWIDLLVGEWLEVFIKDILFRNSEKIGIHDIHRGKLVKKDDVTNELDVVFMKGTSLNIVECKTGAQDHGSWTDVFYKLQAVKQQFGALHINSFLVSASKNILDKDNNIMDAVQKRAAFYKCKIIPAEIIRQLAKASTVEQEYEILKPYV